MTKTTLYQTFRVEIGRSLLSAHIPIPTTRYLQYGMIVTLLCSFLYLIGFLLLSIMQIEINPIPFLPYGITVLLGFILFTSLLISGIYAYPILQAHGRRTGIEMDLPHAVTYMQALSSTLTLYDIFRNVYEAGDLYGEVSKECGLIVRDVEVFGLDLITAMRNTQEATPSDNFKELLNDLSLVYRSGGSLSNFFNSKSESYRELARQEQEALLQILEMIAEVYVTAFVAGPIAIIIMLVAQNLTGQSQLTGIMPLMYLGLPLGATCLIFVLYIILPPDNLDVSRKEIRETEYGSDILEKSSSGKPDSSFLKGIESRKRWLRFFEILRHPGVFFISDSSIGAVIGAGFWGILFYSYQFGSFDSLFPSFTLEVFLCLSIIILIIPVMIAYETRRRHVMTIEKQLPEFLEEIADMRDIGMTLQGAIFMISNNRTGVLSREVKIAADELRLGSSVSGALVRMEERIGLISVKRAISLLVRASEVTDYIREILTIAINDINHYIKMKSKRLNVSFVYLAVIYLSFGIYLYSAYQLNVAFISSFSAYDITFDISGNVRQMLHIGIILGFFSGIMAGQLSSNNILAGFKHVCIMLAATVVLFLYII
ncbi:type II secretion system F family protein [Methanocalculus sp.]|uniref:type II secretion system F family protein n=1 Tax=Methanocalculus sp. TaxID=2004547 RepID=UPI00271B83CC|nr:type II secretion system F family protein [Methanocalculus sp.]MDO8841292.1 type II secretion system F family protein [Methanocalculus sp.]